MTAFECCWSLNDPESWKAIEAFDAEQAAEKYAEQICAHENECYSAFEGNGEDITVRDPHSQRHLGLFTVTVEFEPRFSAGWKVVP